MPKLSHKYLLQFPSSATYENGNSAFGTIALGVGGDLGLPPFPPSRVPRIPPELSNRQSVTSGNVFGFCLPSSRTASSVQDGVFFVKDPDYLFGIECDLLKDHMIDRMHKHHFFFVSL